MRRDSLPLELVTASVRQEPLRLVMMLWAIAAAVALGFAILSINTQATAQFARATRDLSGDAHLVVRGPKDGFPEALYGVLSQRDEVAFASPALELDVPIRGIKDPVKVMGVDVFRVARVQPDLRPVALDDNDALATLRPDQVFASPAAQSLLGLRTGDVLHAQVGTRWLELKVAGTVAAGAQAPILVMDIAAAQNGFQRLGRINRVDLRLADDADADSARAAIAALLPPGVYVDSAAEAQTTGAKIGRAYRVNLNALALVALITAALLVHATAYLSVRRRARQHALWRALGATGPQVRDALLMQALVMGLAGSVLGIAIGYAVAHMILGATRAQDFIMTSGATPAFSLASALVMLVAGTLATLLGAWLPARAGERVQVAQALKGDEVESELHRLPRIWAGVACLGMSAALCLAPALEGLPVFGYGAIALLLAGAIVLLAPLADAALKPLQRAQALAVSLPAAQLRHSLEQVSVSLAATLTAVTLAVAMSIMVTSFRGSLAQWLDHVLPAHLYVRAGPSSDSTFLQTEFTATLRAMPEIERVQWQRTQYLSLSPSHPRVALLARDSSGADLGDTLPLLGAQLAPNQRPHPALWVSEIAQGLYGYKVGDTVTIPLNGSARTFTVAGFWRDYARQQGALLIERQVYVAMTGDHKVTEAALWLRDPGAQERVSAALLRAAGEAPLEVASPEQLRQRSLSIFDHTFAITYAMEAVCMLIGLVALSSGLSALILTRAREFGVWRHLGFTDARIRALLAVEGAMTTGIGLILGLALGWVVSLILIYVVNKQSFHWSMELSIPWIGLALFSLALLALATLSSWWSARHAIGSNIIAAVKHDW